ncbi:hypothetical protein D3C79_836770 [compost metagenome]
MAGDGRHEGHRAGRQHQPVVGEALAIGQGQGAGRPVQRLHLGSQPQRYALRLIPGGIRQLQRLWRLAAKHLGQVHPVIGGVRLGPEHRHLVPRQAASRRQLLDEVVAHHAVADHQQTLFLAPLGRFDEVVVQLIIHTVADHQQTLLLNPLGGSDDLVIDQVQALAHHLQSLFVSHISLP